MQESLDDATSDSGRAAIASLIPMAAGVLTGNVSEGAQLGLKSYQTLEDQRQKSRSKLLDYLSKMKPASEDGDWKLQQVDGKMVKISGKTGQIVPTDYKPFEKDTVPSWQQVGGAKTATFFRKNPLDNSVDIYKTDIPVENKFGGSDVAWANYLQRIKEHDDLLKKQKEEKIQKAEKEVSPLLEIDYHIKNLDKMVPSKGSIPGVGFPENMLNNIGIRPFGEKGKEISNSLSNLRDTIAKLRSGGQVTEDEAKRLEQSLGTGSFDSETDFRIAMKNFKNVYGQIMATKRGAYESDVLSEFDKRISANKEAMSSSVDKSQQKKFSKQSELDKINAELAKRGIK